MEKLENLVKKAFQKHPVISTFVALKAVDIACIITAHYIWPEQTSQVLNHAYGAAKASAPFAALCVANWPNEVITVCRDIPNMYYLI